MHEITVYFPTDGSVVIRWPKDYIPDRDTLERVAQAISEHKKSPAPCGNMERGSCDLAQENSNTAE